jgi:integrase/recombinase XerD
MNDLGAILYRYFELHLKAERGMRPATIRSYSETIRLFLTFTAAQTRRRVTRLTLADLTADRVRAFLSHLEQGRGNSIATRNQRLAALRTFFAFVASGKPEALQEAQRVAYIPTKRTPPPGTRYLERDQVDALFAGLPATGAYALRDHALLLFLYNTGARAQETADLRTGDLHLQEPARAVLHGKGGKHRSTPLWPRTAELLDRLLEDHPEPRDPSRLVFISRRGTPLTRFGIYKLVQRHTSNLPTSLGNERGSISPHVLRHTTAVHLLEAGVEVNVIRAWLGHASIDTTNRYAEINTRTKEAALEACLPPPTSGKFPRKPVWQDDRSLLAWLQNL